MALAETAETLPAVPLLASNQGISCVFMMSLATAAAWCASYSPNRLGVAAQFLDSSLVFEAGDVARDDFIGRIGGFQV